MFRHLQRDENSVLSQQSVELHDQIYKPADVSNTYSLIFPTSLFSIIVLRAEALGQSSVENGPKDSFVQSLSALQADSLTFLRLAPPGGHLKATRSALHALELLKNINTRNLHL